MQPDSFANFFRPCQPVITLLPCYYVDGRLKLTPLYFRKFRRVVFALQFSFSQRRNFKGLTNYLSKLYQNLIKTQKN